MKLQLRYFLSFILLTTLLLSCGNKKASFSPIEDAYVFQGDFADLSVSDMERVDVKSSKDTLDEFSRVAYMKFKLPANKKSVGKASFNFYATTVNPIDFTLRIFETDTTWKGDSLNWKNKPALSKFVDSIWIGKEEKLYQVDISNLINRYLKNKYTVLSLGLKADTATNPVKITSGDAPAKSPFISFSSGDTIRVAEDCYARSGYNSLFNLGGEEEMILFSDDDSTDVHNTFIYMKFDPFKEELGVSKAILKLSASIESKKRALDTATIAVYPVSTDWSENLITGAKRPKTYGPQLGTFKVKGLDIQTYEVDLTQYFKSFNGRKEPVSFLIKALSEGKGKVVIMSKESEMAPKLVFNE